MIKKIEWFILTVLLIAIGAFTLNWALKGIIHSRKNVSVPNLVGKAVMEALDILAEQNLGLKKEGFEFNEKLPAGTILRQHPVAGMSVREGKVVRVTISQGGETVYVPDLKGRSLRSAEIALRSAFLSLGEVLSQPSIKFEKDMVISQQPVAGTIVPKNFLVRLTISNGSSQDVILMPDFIEKSWSEVQSWGEVIGIKVEKTEESSSWQPEVVLQQEVPPDTPLQSGSTIKFVVSSGKIDFLLPTDSMTQKSSKKFRLEVPQGEVSKQYVLVLLDSSGSREFWRGNLLPGSKHEILLPSRVSGSAVVRVFVDGILTNEQNIQ